MTAPAIYGLIIPVVILDLFCSLYQAICFPVYQIPKVKRKQFLALDRKKLKYLTTMQQLNCLYCDYANGIIAYASEIAGRTEWYWCPIKHPEHAKRAHPHYENFIEFGDGEAFAKKHRSSRLACRACESDCNKPE